MEERKTLDELKRLVETGHIVGLTPDQTAIALSAIKFYAAVTATTGILAGVRSILLWFGGALAMWWAARDVIIQFVKSSAGGG